VPGPNGRYTHPQQPLAANTPQASSRTAAFLIIALVLPAKRSD
jgi:hypothetical protein